MKYIEELSNGHVFSVNDKFYVLSSDYKKNHKSGKNRHMCVEVSKGTVKWFDSDQIADDPPVFYQDSENVLHQMEFSKNEEN